MTVYFGNKAMAILLHYKLKNRGLFKSEILGLRTSTTNSGNRVSILFLGDSKEALYDFLISNCTSNCELSVSDDVELKVTSNRGVSTWLFRRLRPNVCVDKLDLLDDSVESQSVDIYNDFRNATSSVSGEFKRRN